ncbi:MAG: toll/interleukin-1 receptor domain-containing protein [Planctomycetota bacterium]|nr:toll/interleukin-1 receptor domain-containing protein [Planctomycetota bacterium]
MAGGSVAIRGFLVQTLIGLLEALDDKRAWNSVTLEPDVDSEKVDILWEYPDGTKKAVQVKSSQNPFVETKVETWAADLEAWQQADEYELVLVGIVTPAVAKLHRIGKVAVPAPKTLDILALKEQAAQKLNHFLKQRRLPHGDPDHLEMLVGSLVDRLETFSTDGTPLKREALITKLRTWLAPLPPAPPDASAIELVLRRYCEERVKEWNETRADPKDRDKLLHYVEPHYSLLQPGRAVVEASSTAGRGGADPEKRDDAYQPVAAEGDDAIAELVKLLNASRRLCITEDAGAGKSIFTRRLLAFLCSPEGQQALFEGKPYLAVRWEQRVRSWPESFTRAGLTAALAEAVATTIEATGANVSSTEVAEWTLREGRAFLILDALDQVPHKQSVASLEQSLHTGPAQTCHIVLTSRAYAVTDHATLFHETRGWKFGRLDAFDKQQQEQYLAGLYQGGLKALFPNYPEVEQLLRIPVVLAMIRELAEASKLKAFRTRGDLYLQVHEHLTARAARKRGPQPDSDQLVRWCEILAATACEMMVRGVYNYAVQGADISHCHEDGDFAELLKLNLEKAGHTAWVDTERLTVGVDWREEIDQAIRDALALIAIMTPTARSSEYVTYEWAFAWGVGVKVIPILLANTQLHPRLEALQYLNFSNRAARPWTQLLAVLEQIKRESAR